ncbi:hypothetical protein HDU87_008642 [Geranomyces variabilis]|uniref:Uncharacterized protein n=1 Tax=Geranomyces variabilis TaxID=109894 RepID=A0AAD5XP65_9FUNG|nr:hypothetical protein HDU87_008642 [Geranomyces variabilis]
MSLATLRLESYFSSYGRFRLRDDLDDKVGRRVWPRAYFWGTTAVLLVAWITFNLVTKFFFFCQAAVDNLGQPTGAKICENPAGFLAPIFGSIFILVASLIISIIAKHAQLANARTAAEDAVIELNRTAPPGGPFVWHYGEEVEITRYYRRGRQRVIHQNHGIDGHPVVQLLAAAGK